MLAAVQRGACGCNVIEIQTDTHSSPRPNSRIDKNESDQAGWLFPSLGGFDRCYEVFFGSPYCRGFIEAASRWIAPCSFAYCYVTKMNLLNTYTQPKLGIPWRRFAGMVVKRLYIRDLGTADEE